MPLNTPEAIIEAKMTLTEAALRAWRRFWPDDYSVVVSAIQEMAEANKKDPFQARMLLEDVLGLDHPRKHKNWRRAVPVIADALLQVWSSLSRTTTSAIFDCVRECAAIKDQRQDEPVMLLQDLIQEFSLSRADVLAARPKQEELAQKRRDRDDKRYQEMVKTKVRNERQAYSARHGGRVNA